MKDRIIITTTTSPTMYITLFIPVFLPDSGVVSKKGCCSYPAGEDREQHDDPDRDAEEPEANCTHVV
jgi:hypothetical protein